MDRDIVGEGTKSNADEFSPKTWSVETTQQRMQSFQEHPSKSQRHDMSFRDISHAPLTLTSPLSSSASHSLLPQFCRFLAK
jgi:hypothetical protein